MRNPDIKSGLGLFLFVWVVFLAMPAAQFPDSLHTILFRQNLLQGNLYITKYQLTHSGGYNFSAINPLKDVGGGWLFSLSP